MSKATGASTGNLPVTQDPLRFLFEGLEVRAVDRDGNPWFIGLDVCKALGIKNPYQALSRLPESDRATIKVPDALGREQDTTIISLAGVFRLVLTSRVEGAERFKVWLTTEVLPSIYRGGTYSTTPALPSPTPPVPALPELSAMRYDAFQGQLDMIRRASQSRDDNLTRALVESNAAHDRATRQLASDVAFLTKQVAQLKAELGQGAPTKRPALPHRPNTDPEAEWENVDPNRVLVCRRLDNDSLSVYIRDEQDPRRSVIYVTRGRTQGTVATPPELRP